MLNALKNLFSFRSPALQSLQDISSDEALDQSLDSRPSGPILVAGEMNDNSLIVLREITALTSMMEVDLLNSKIYDYYENASQGSDNPDLDEDELALMDEWVAGDVLPDKFRKSLIEFFDRVDGISELLVNLSQHRFERLRTWSAHNV